MEYLLASCAREAFYAIKADKIIEAADIGQAMRDIMTGGNRKNRKPVTGPALFRFPLSLIAKKAWKNAPRPLREDEVFEVSNRRVNLVTLYCHLLDFAKEAGTWRPPQT